jgi:hypothetical protein
MLRRLSSEKKLPFTLISLRRVFGSADHSEADRKSGSSQRSGTFPASAPAYGIYNLPQLLNLLALLVNEQLRVTDNVDEQDVAGRELHV